LDDRSQALAPAFDSSFPLSSEVSLSHEDVAFHTSSFQVLRGQSTGRQKFLGGSFVSKSLGNRTPRITGPQPPIGLLTASPQLGQCSLSSAPSDPLPSALVSGEALGGQRNWEQGRDGDGGPGLGLEEAGFGTRGMWGVQPALLWCRPPQQQPRY
jgi:hypothetical protein